MTQLSDDTAVRTKYGSLYCENRFSIGTLLSNAAKCFHTCDTGSTCTILRVLCFFQFFVNRYRTWPFPAITINNVLYEIYELSARSPRDTLPRRCGIKLNFMAIRFPPSPVVCTALRCFDTVSYCSDSAAHVYKYDTSRLYLNSSNIIIIYILQHTWPHLMCAYYSPYDGYNETRWNINYLLSSEPNF